MKTSYCTPVATDHLNEGGGEVPTSTDLAATWVWPWRGGIHGYGASSGRRERIDGVGMASAVGTAWLIMNMQSETCHLPVWFSLCWGVAIKQSQGWHRIV